YTEYSKRYKSREDAKEVAFRVGVVLADSGQKESAAKAFADYAHAYPGTAQTVEALTRAGAALISAGQYKKAEEPLKNAVALFKRGDKSAAGAAAHAKYLLGEILFHDFERVQLANDPKKLKRTLDEKSVLLEKAKQAYVDTLTFNDPEWATAALFRIG